MESAWKLAKQYFKLTGKPTKHKVISRNVAYHGTPQGALSITGIPDAKTPFEPLVPGGIKVPNTNFYRAQHHADDIEAYGRWAADRIAEAIEFEGPDSVAAVFLEPVQNSGGCFPPPPGYFERVREICDEYDVLFVADETICAIGRIGDYFAMNRYGVQPDIITFAKGLTSGYSPMGAMMVHDRLFEPFKHGTTTFLHGYTWGGHPVSAAAALANLDIFEREGLNAHVQANEGAFRATLEKLLDLPIVGDVRGAGYFYGIELVKDKATKETFNDAESERLLRGFLSKALFDAGLYCRADDRGDPVIQLAPPLIVGQQEFDEIESILRARAHPRHGTALGHGRAVGRDRAHGVHPQARPRVPRPGGRTRRPGRGVDRPRRHRGSRRCPGRAAGRGRPGSRRRSGAVPWLDRVADVPAPGCRGTGVPDGHASGRARPRAQRVRVEHELPLRGRPGHVRGPGR